MLVLALSTPGNVTTAAIAGVALLLGVLLMARGRRVDAEAGAAVAGPPPEASDAAPHAAAQPDPEPPSATPATPDAAAADPAIVAADEAPSAPQRIRLGGTRFGETAVQATASEDSEPAPPAESAPAAPNEEEPAGPQRIRLRGARFGPAAPEEPPAAAEEPPAAAEDPPASAEPAAGPALEAWRLRARQPEAAAAKPGRIRLGERRFLPATPIAPEPADSAPEPADSAPEPADTAPEPADSAPEPAAAPPDAAASPALPPASGFRQGSIRLRE